MPLVRMKDDSGMNIFQEWGLRKFHRSCLDLYHMKLYVLLEVMLHCSYHTRCRVKKAAGGSEESKAVLRPSSAAHSPVWVTKALSCCLPEQSCPLLQTWSKSFTFSSLIFSDFKVSQIDYIASFLQLISSSFISWVRKVIWLGHWGAYDPYRGSGNSVANFEERQKWC